jgi:excisionase family DNA binding protein
MENQYNSYDQLPLSLNANEVAQVLGISRSMAYALMRSKGFPSLRIGTRWTVPKQKLLAWVEKQTVA